MLRRDYLLFDEHYQEWWEAARAAAPFYLYCTLEAQPSPTQTLVAQPSPTQTLVAQPSPTVELEVA